uniref:Pseudouridylate synthase 1 homolog n=1 Tax=Trichobilharzia regenti TaxID=157069 RepID=A0AA85KLT0_TRIRE|nr:unnamed protein product [Trichobilharzia regenti]
MRESFNFFKKAFRTIMSVLESTEIKLETAISPKVKADDLCVTTTNTNTDAARSGGRLRRKKCAILMMYSGWGFYGMQRCPVFPTIEGELSKALFACGQLESLTGEEHKKFHFQRASKTDKSVSALGQVCSMLLGENNDLISKLNDALPENIRILDIIRTTRCFSAKGSCSHRVYDYLLPTFALSPSSFSTSLNDSSCWNYRVTAEQITRANHLLGRYQGTHNFYNFTSGRLATDKSCNRFIISAECMPAFLLGEHEYTLIRITGQSFMLHQIRKMIGLMLAILKDYTQEDIFDLVFQRERVDIPKAPGLGLMLNQVDFSQYNQKYQNDGIHDPIDWSKYEERRDKFKLQYVYEHIDRVETEEKSMYEWLLTLNNHTYTYRDSSEHTATINNNNNINNNNAETLETSESIVPLDDVGNADDKSTHIDDDDDDDNGNVVTTTDDVIKDDSDIPLKRERLAL